MKIKKVWFDVFVVFFLRGFQVMLCVRVPLSLQIIEKKKLFKIIQSTSVRFLL